MPQVVCSCRRANFAKARSHGPPTEGRVVVLDRPEQALQPVAADGIACAMTETNFSTAACVTLPRAPEDLSNWLSAGSRRVDARISASASLIRSMARREPRQPNASRRNRARNAQLPEGFAEVLLGIDVNPPCGGSTPYGIHATGRRWRSCDRQSARSSARSLHPSPPSRAPSSMKYSPSSAMTASGSWAPMVMLSCDRGCRPDARAMEIVAWIRAAVVGL